MEIKPNEFISLQTEWRRNRNEEYRRLKNISHADFIAQVMGSRETIERDMDSILPPHMHSCTVPKASDYTIIYP